MLRKLDGLTGFLDLHIRDAAIESKERRALLHTFTLHGARFCHQAGHWHPNPRIRRWHHCGIGEIHRNAFAA